MSAAKNAVMNQTAQHEFHPDAESLNAFAEQALDQRERSHVLSHLAVCARCREVVTLAQRVARAEVELAVPAAAAASRPTAQPRAWWNSWRLAWALPAAALAATITFAVYLHHEQLARTAEMAKNAAPVSQDETLPANALQPEQPKPAPATTSPTGAGPADRKLKREAVVGSAGPSLRKLDSAPPPPAPPATTPATVTAQKFAPEVVSAYQGLPPESIHGQSPSSFNKFFSPQATDQQALQMEQRKQIEQGDRPLQKAAAYDHLLSTKTAPSVVPQAPPAVFAPGSNGRASANSQPAALSAGSLASFAELSGLPVVADAKRIGKPIHLPSKLASISAVFAGNRVLAIDSANTLFVSADSGSAWTRVSPQWTGRAILIRARGTASDRADAAHRQADVAQTAGLADTTPSIGGPVSLSSTVFEIVNDKDQVWTSADGLVWTAR